MSSSTVSLEVLFFAKAREILKTSESQITIATNISSAQGNLLEGIDNKTVKRQRLMSCPFTGPKMFCASPNFLSQPKNLTPFSASSKTFVLAQKPILLNANHLFVWHKMFVTATICK